MLPLNCAYEGPGPKGRRNPTPVRRTAVPRAGRIRNLSATRERKQEEERSWRHTSDEREKRDEMGEERREESREREAKIVFKRRDSCAQVFN